LGKSKATRTTRSGPTDFCRLAALFKLASNPVRLRVLLLLGDGERSVGDLQSEIACSMTVLSRHLPPLRLTGLVVSRQDGQRVVYALTDAGRDMRRGIAKLID
jgi:DNA-binding transcriptional ArsR family regulator